MLESEFSVEVTEWKARSWEHMKKEDDLCVCVCEMMMVEATGAAEVVVNC